MDQRRSRGDRQGRRREDRHGQGREDRHGREREDRHKQRREDRHGQTRENRHGQHREDRHGRRREGRHGHSRENREHVQEQRERDPRGFPEGMGPSQSRYATEPLPARHPVTNQGYATQPDPRYQEDYYNSGYDRALETYPPQDQQGYRDSSYRGEDDYPPKDQRGYRDSRYQQEQEDYPPKNQRGYRDSRYHGEQEDYPPRNRHSYHDSRHQREQEDYPPMDQHGHHDSRHQREQEDYPPIDQHGHHDLRQQPEQEDYPPMNQCSYIDSRQHSEQEDYPPKDQRYDDSRHQREQEDYPSQNQHGHHDTRHQPEQEDYPPMDQHGHHDSRHQPEQEDYPHIDQYGHHESRYQQQQGEYPFQDQNGQVDPKYQGNYPPFDQDRFSSAQQHQKQDISAEEKEKHPILRRRVISDGCRVLNPMGIRLRRCLPEFDFDTFADQLGEDELKTFLPHQHSQAGSVYQGEGEEETEERRLFAKELVSMMEDGETGKGTAGKKLSSFDKNWKDAKTQVREALQWFVVWRGSFKEIEAQHGSSTTSYFSVLRWLMFLNLFVTVIMVATIVLPQVYFHPDTFNETIVTTNQTEMPGGFVKNASECSDVYQQTLNLTDEQRMFDKVLAVIQGTGWMEKTVLFSGHYFSKTFEFENLKLRSSYHMPLAFLFTTAAYFFITIILMILYTGDGVKQRMLASDEDTHLVFNKVFSGWDYSLMQDQAGELKKEDLVEDFKIFVTQIKERKKREGVNTKLKYLARAFVNLLVLGAWAGSGYVIYMVITEWTDDLANADIVKKQSVLALFVEFLPSVTLTGLNIIVPSIFSTLVKIEYLSPDAVIEITVARSVVLRLASVIVLVVSLHARIIDCRDDDVDGCKNCKEIPCWETYVGIEFYKLAVMDIFVNIITTVVEFIRRIVPKCVGDKALFGRLVALKEFDLPNNVLGIVYAQTICWLGAFFCPLIPAITVVKFFLYFYLKKITLLKNYPSSPSAFRASKTNSFFMAILLVSIVVCAIAMGFVIGRVHPSQSCGPWRVYSKDDYYMYMSVSDLVATAPRVWGNILGFFISWLFYVPMLIVMSLVIYYNMAVAAGNKTIISKLREELILEGRDKQFGLEQMQTLLDPANQQTNTRPRYKKQKKRK